MFRSPVVDAIVVLVIALLILGPKRLPGLGKGLGQGMREFKEGITGDSKSDDQPEITQATSMPDTSNPDRPAEPTAVRSPEGDSERRA